MFVVMAASITRSASAARLKPLTSMLKLISACTSPVNVALKLPLFKVSVTVSPAWASPPAKPVIATVPAASAMLMMSSAVMFASRVMVGTGTVRSTV